MLIFTEFNNMGWFLTIILAQFLLPLENVYMGADASKTISGSSSARINHMIQDYIDEDVGPFISCESIQKEAVIGDLIEFDRYGSPFNHWAIYIGNGKVADPFVLENIGLDEYFSTTRALFLRSTLTNVAEGDYCRVNNKERSAKRRGLKSLSTEEIMKLVQKSLGGFDYNFLNFNCEHKVTQLKYGLAFSDQADAVKGIANEIRKPVEYVLTLLCDASLSASAASLSTIHKVVENWIDEDVDQFLNPQLVIQEAKLYDIIEFKRSGYSHYAIYIGNGYVQHLSHDYEIFKTILETRNGRILREKLIDVAGKDLCRVNNKIRSAKRRGLKQLEPQQIKTNLDALENTTVEYSIYSYNCEHIVTQWRFGKAFSDQVDALEKISEELRRTAALYVFYAFTGQTIYKQFGI